MFVALSANAQQPPDIVHSDAYFNTAMGYNALQFQIPVGSQIAMNNTASGYETMQGNASGKENTANGASTIASNFTSNDNTAIGFAALAGNITGNDNTAVGDHALGENQAGVHNTSTGSQVLSISISTKDNNAYGAFALFNNHGNDNAAIGFEALYNNQIGTLNNASGNYALKDNSSGSNNNAIGYAALSKNTTGSNNNAQGFYALQGIIDSSNNNIGIGQYAGSVLVQGSNNIYIGNPGFLIEDAIIRIGNPATHIVTYLAGIENAHITGAPVYVTSDGQLGVLASSERYKTDIRPIGAIAKLELLRPVTFHLKTGPNGNLQYGLIAEEVEKVYPELVIHGADRTIEGVRYDELGPLLLQEVQNQAKSIREMQRQVADLKHISQSMLAELPGIRTVAQLGKR
jgi:hypothetical protein